MQKFFCAIIFILLVFSPYAWGKETTLEISDAEFAEKLSENKNWELYNVKVRQDSACENIQIPWTESFYLNDFCINKLFTAEFENKGNNAVIEIKIYEAAGPNSAFGIYSLERTPSLTFKDLGFESYFLRNSLISWYGKYLVTATLLDIWQDRVKMLSEINEFIIRNLPKQENDMPLLEALPNRDKVRYSEKLLPYRWLDQTYLKNIYYADYQTREGYCRIFVINNRSTSKCDSNYWRYYDFARKNGIVSDREMKIRTDYFVINEPVWGESILAKKNQIIYGILDFKNSKWAEDRMEDVLEFLKKNKIVKSG